jgi:hypothetical protein
MSREFGTPSQAKPIADRWRRLLRVSVRALIVLVLVIGGGLGCLVHSARVQREAVAAINQAGGCVLYDWNWKDGEWWPDEKPFAPQWIVDRIGVDYFGHPAAAYISQEGWAAALPYGGQLSQV